MHATLPLDRMTVPEKLRAMEDIWDDLCHIDNAIRSAGRENQRGQ